jgi:hypothetical protein
MSYKYLVIRDDGVTYKFQASLPNIDRQETFRDLGSIRVHEMIEHKLTFDLLADVNSSYPYNLLEQSKLSVADLEWLRRNND